MLCRSTLVSSAGIWKPAKQRLLPSVVFKPPDTAAWTYTPLNKQSMGNCTNPANLLNPSRFLERGMTEARSHLRHTPPSVLNMLVPELTQRCVIVKRIEQISNDDLQVGSVSRFLSYFTCGPGISVPPCCNTIPVTFPLSLRTACIRSIAAFKRVSASPMFAARNFSMFAALERIAPAPANASRSQSFAVNSPL
jgi:hypothetical protein